MLIHEVLKIRDFSKPLRLLFANPQLLRDPLWGRDPPVGNHWLRLSTTFLMRAYKASKSSSNSYHRILKTHPSFLSTADHLPIAFL